MTKFKQFIQRHSFILIIFVAVVIAGTNYLIYPTFIKKQLNLVDVPVALVEIQENVPITKDMIGTISIDKTFLPTNIVTDKELIVDMYVAEKNTIPVNGFFYANSLVDAPKALGKTFANLNENEYAYAIELSNAYKETSIFKENQKINVYYYEEYENELGTKAYMVGQLAENVRIVNIIGDEKTGKQSYVILALNEEQFGNFVLAGQYGTLVPALNWQSNGLDFKPTDFYNINNLIAHLEEQSTIFKKQSIIDDEKTETSDINESVVVSNGVEDTTTE